MCKLEVKAYEKDERCAKCKKLSRVGKLFTDFQYCMGRTREWRVFICTKCLGIEPKLPDEKGGAK